MPVNHATPEQLAIHQRHIANDLAVTHIYCFPGGYPIYLEQIGIGFGGGMWMFVFHSPRDRPEIGMVRIKEKTRGFGRSRCCPKWNAVKCLFTFFFTKKKKKLIHFFFFPIFFFAKNSSMFLTIFHPSYSILRCINSYFRCIPMY